MERKIDVSLIESTRLDKGIEKTEFCKSNGINITTYNRILKNPEARTKDNTILRIARALEIKPSEIINFS